MRRRAANPSGARILGGALGLWSIIEIHRSQRSSPVCGLDCKQLPPRRQWCDMFMHLRRKFGSQTSDNMDRLKSRGGKSQRRKRKKKEDQSRERESVRMKKIPKREKVEKSRNTVFFPMFCGSGGSKSRLAKAAGAEPFGQMREINNCTPLWREDARSTFGSQNAKNTLGSEHLWKLKC